MTVKTSDEDLRNKLGSIRKKLTEGEELSAEASRRYQVANEKLAGYLIEFIESQRGKLKEKKKIGRLLAILLRTTDLRGHLLIQYGQYFSSAGSTHKALPMLHATRKMIEVYEGIRNDLSRFLYEDDSRMPNLPYISGEPLDPESKLQELNVCIGQLLGHILGKLYEHAF